MTVGGVNYVRQRKPLTPEDIFLIYNRFQTHLQYAFEECNFSH